MADYAFQLGLFAPNGNTNLALKDVITGLKFLQKVVPSFGGNAGKITVAGQSSGANMIRALLATPSASSLFVSGILQSDPMVSINALDRNELCDKNNTHRETDTGNPGSQVMRRI